MCVCVSMSVCTRIWAIHSCGTQGKGFKGDDFERFKILNTISSYCPPLSAPLLINVLLPNLYGRVSWGLAEPQMKTLRRQEWKKIRQTHDERVLTHLLMVQRHTHRSCVQCEHKTRNESRHWQREGMSFLSGLIVRDECDRLGAEGKQTSCLSCEIEEDQSVSES